MENQILHGHLTAAWEHLTLAYNTVKDDKVDCASCGTVWALAEVSAQLQYQNALAENEAKEKEEE